jgi:hypothetical protein
MVHEPAGQRAETARTWAAALSWPKDEACRRPGCRGGRMKEALLISDQRNQAKYEIPIQDGTIRAMDLRQIKTALDDFGLMTYDPAFMNTAACRSAITFIDGDKGILRYRGYPIEILAEKCNYLEVAYLILFGDLPTEPQLTEWVREITHHTMLHETTKKFLELSGRDDSIGRSVAAEGYFRIRCALSPGT